VALSCGRKELTYFGLNVRATQMEDDRAFWITASYNVI